MKKIFFIAIFVFTIFNFAAAQRFPVDTLQWSADTNIAINLVIVGDGYTASEMNRFITDARSAVNGFFEETPYRQYRNFFNVFAIRVPSNQSGISGQEIQNDAGCHGTIITRDTYFRLTFCAHFNMQRLLYFRQGSDGISRLMAVLQNNTPYWDEAVVIANTTRYGGAGGAFATFSVNSAAIDLFLHEVAHSFVGLADEYWHAGNENAPNMTSQTNTSLLKWRNWLNVPGINPPIGHHRHGTSGMAANWFKPTTGNRCKMETLSNSPPFCAVCREATIEKIYEVAEFLVDYEPALTGVQIAEGRSMDFDLYLLKPEEPNTQRIRWTLNNQPFSPTVTNNQASISVSAANLIVGQNNRLTAAISDTSAMLRPLGASQSNQTVTWNITRGSAASIHNNTARTRGTFVGIVNQELRLLLPSAANTADVALYDIKGRLLFRTNIDMRGSFASIALPKSISSNKAVILQVRTDTGFSKNKMVLIR
jgi:hypothetical protein